MEKEAFIGTWRLVSIEFLGDDGRVSQPFGANPLGYIFYTADNHMSVTFMTADRLHFNSPFAQMGSLEEKASAMDSFFSFCGTYEIQGAEMVHHVEVSLFPNWTGKDQRRFYQIEGRRLTLSAKAEVFGGKDKTQTAFLVWERV